MEISKTQLEGLRALRLHHYKGVKASERDIRRWNFREDQLLNKPLKTPVKPGLMATMIGRLSKIKLAKEEAIRIKIYQQTQVAFLDTFFQPDDTAEKDAEK